MPKNVELPTDRPTIYLTVTNRKKTRKTAFFNQLQNTWKSKYGIKS